jgi:rhamnose transport system substrate-binding protein
MIHRIHGSRTRRLSAVTFAVALVTLVAGCSSSKKAAPAASSAAPTTSAAAPATSAAPAATSAAAPATSAAAAPTSAAAGSGAPANIKKGLVVYFIPKDTQNPYEVIADKGGAAALAELGGKVVVSSGTADTAAAQIPSIQAAIQAKADAIVIAGNDPSALCPSLAQAQAAGIKVVSFDSDVTCPNHLFINQANTEQIGTSEVDLLAKEINSTGQIAILSAAATATNQNAWIGYMKQQLAKYPNMKLVSTVYGNDDPATSLTVLQGLLSAYPNLAGIISPTTVGISTAAQYLDNHKSLLSHLTLTGLGLPSQMKTYVLDGTVKAFELWNPSDLGYLAGYAAAQAASGTDITTSGATFTAGKLGSYTVLPAAGTTGPSVVLGPPTVFDASNVAQFNF